MAEEIGVGEIIIQSISKDGTMEGYDIDLIKSVCDAVSIPVVALGGAGKLEDFKKVYAHGNALGIAAGSFFIYQGCNKGVLINYPSWQEVSKIKV